MKKPIVLVVPGILGSDLSDTQPSGYGRVWLDYLGVVGGQLRQLQLDDDGRSDANSRVRIEATGIFESYYGDLIKKLNQHDFDARPHFFDWRRDIRQSAATLATVIEALPADAPLSLVAHSMGGLVSRRLFQAHGSAAARVNRLIMLGTPNYGSFEPVTVFSGQSTLLRWVAAIDLWNSEKKLLNVFRSFPGLIEMLPSPAKFAEINFFRSGTWTADGPAADALVRARRLQEQLAEDLPARSRYTLIAGYGRETITRAELCDAGEFKFQSSEKGDGTVPLHFCLLEGIERTYFTGAKHGALPATGEVIDAVCRILAGDPVDLPTSLPLSRVRSALSAYVPPPPPQTPLFLTAMRTRTARRRLPPKLTTAQRRELERKTAEAQSAFLATAEARPKVRTRKVTPTPAALPGRARRLLVKTVLGSVTGAPSSALVLGVFPGVRPQSSLAAVDRKVNGYITRLFEQGAIHAGAGEVLFLPVPGAAIPAEMIVLVGLGEARFFNDDTLRRVGENLAEAFMQVRMTEFATVPIGSGSSLNLTDSLKALLEGLLIGLDRVDPDRLFRTITICEADRQRIGTLRDVVTKSGPYWAARGVDLEHKELPDLPPPPTDARQLRYSELSYWIEAVPGKFRYFLLGAATIPEDYKADPHLEKHVRDLQAAMEEHTSNAQKVAALDAFGARVRKGFPNSLLEPLRSPGRFTEATLNLAQATASIAWELLPAGNKPIGLQLSVTRRLAISADHRPVANYLPSEREQRPLRVAIVADPTDDLEGARHEGEDLSDFLRRDPHFEVQTFIGSKQSTEAAVTQLMKAGAVDVLHYAGHGDYDVDHPERSGLVVPGERDEMLTAREVRTFLRPPLLIFANACRVGIIGVGPDGAATRRSAKWRSARARQPFGFAEALLQAGVRAYVGTFWSIPDDVAVTFSKRFYQAIARGKTLGEAMLEARLSTHDARGNGQWAWASYMLYGPAWLRLVE